MELINEIFLTEAFNANKDSIIDLVTNKRVISIAYRGDKENAPGWRTIEPACYGSRKGRDYIRAWQQGGKTTTIQPGWKFFRVDRIRNWNLSSNKVADKSRPLFNPNGDKLLDKIYAISDFNKKAQSDKIEPKKSTTLQTPGTGTKKSAALVKRLKTLEEIFLMEN